MGQGAYVDDYHPPGLLYAAFLRSFHAHALITRLDPSLALALPGVVAVVTGEELVDCSINS
jgi:CO/xanthine dehydrogenase Mo-binding subunit